MPVLSPSSPSPSAKQVPPPVMLSAASAQESLSLLPPSDANSPSGAVSATGSSRRVLAPRPVRGVPPPSLPLFLSAGGEEKPSRKKTLSSSQMLSLPLLLPAQNFRTALASVRRRPVSAEKSEPTAAAANDAADDEGCHRKTMTTTTRTTPSLRPRWTQQPCLTPTASTTTTSEGPTNATGRSNGTTLPRDSSPTRKYFIPDDDDLFSTPPWAAETSGGEKIRKGGRTSCNDDATMWTSSPLPNPKKRKVSFPTTGSTAASPPPLSSGLLLPTFDEPLPSRRRFSFAVTPTSGGSDDESTPPRDADAHVQDERSAAADDDDALSIDKQDEYDAKSAFILVAPQELLPGRAPPPRLRAGAAAGRQRLLLRPRPSAAFFRAAVATDPHPINY